MISNRVFWAGVVLASVSILSAGVVAQQAITPTLRTQRLEVVDKQGRVRAVLTTDETDSPQFTYHDALGGARPALAAASPATPGMASATAPPAPVPAPAAAAPQGQGQPVPVRAGFAPTNGFGVSAVTTERDTIGTLRIKGTVRNQTGQTAPFVQIKFRVLDAAGAQLDTAYTVTTDLKPGADWKFEVFSTANEKAARVEMISVSTSALD